LISSLFGLGVASRHVWILSHPEVSCGIDPLETWINQFQIVNGLPWLFKADGFCTAQLPLIFGLAVPVWSLIWFVLLTGILLVTLFKKK
jgi:disulfide bond formation protein DsbB